MGVTGFAILLAAGYLLLMAFYWAGWRSQSIFELQQDFQPTASLSVLIAARNEASRILACLEAVSKCTYPVHLLEIIVIDDGSTDDTANIVRQWGTAHGQSGIKVLELRPGVGKKAALTAGMQEAKGAYIVCTDADCEPPRNWLLLMAQSLAQPQVKIVTGPVVFHREQSLLEWFQSLDLMGLMGITASGIHWRWQHMANGANLAYAKSVFHAVHGYEGNTHIASGDDLFLVQKVAQKWPGSVFFLKSPAAAVRTSAMPDWKAFVHQRIRWGSKNAALPEWPVRLSLAWVFGCCWALPVYAVTAIVGGTTWGPFMILLGAKTVADAFFLYQMSVFFNKKEAFRWFLPAQIVHILYIVLVGSLSIFYKKYKWR